MLRLSRLLASTSRGKTIQFGGDARELMLNGIERIATAVGVTLGPKGRNVIIRQADGEPKITKDGVTVARSIEFNDPFEDVGARLIRHVASKTNDVAGDGTTTATILAWRIFAEGYKSVSTGANPMDLKRGIDAAVSVLLESLSSQRRPVRGLPMLEDVATISANGERPLGRLIAAAVAAVGAAGHVAVVEGAGPATAWTRPGGWSVERGIAAGALVTNAAALRGRLDAPLVLVAAERLEAPADALRLLDAAKARGRPLVVVAPGIGEAAMQVLVHNHTQGVVLCGAVCVPELCEEEMCDVAACCGCRVEKIDAIAHVGDVACLLGEAVRVEQSFDSTVIAGSADPAPRVRLLEEKLQRALTEDAKEKLRERIAKLNHTFAVIRVGGRSAVEISESKDRVIDALNASRNALSDGIVAGGGAALLHASKKLDEMLHTEDEMDQDRRTGILIVRNAARLPMKCISDNAGEEGAVTVENVAEYEDCCMGYDAQKGEYVDMFEAGIIDPVKVVSSCEVDAASVAGLMITTEASVCDFVENAQLVGGVSGRE